MQSEQDLLMRKKELLEQRANILRQQGTGNEQASQPQAESKGVKGTVPAALLGLLQGIENVGKGYTAGAAEMEVSVPDMFKPEKIRGEREVHSPSFNFEQYVNPENKTAFTVGENVPLIAALLGGGYKSAGALGKFTNKSIGNNIINDVKQQKKYFNKEYENLWNEAEKAGVGKLKTSASRKELFNILSQVPDKKYYKGLEEAIANPTARNMHKAQSDLGKFVRKIQSKHQPTPAESKALKLAIDNQAKIQEDLANNLLKSKNPALLKDYQNLQDQYKMIQVPFLENKDVRRASLKPGQKGYMNPSRLPKKLMLEGNDPLRAHLRGDPSKGNEMINPYLHGRYGELETNRLASSPYTWGALAGTGLVGASLKKILGFD